MEPISLQFSSPKTQLPGFDAAIEQMEAIVQLQGQIAAMDGKTITLNFKTNGMEAAVSGMTKIKAGIQSVTDAFEKQRNNFAELQAALKAIGQGGAYATRFEGSAQERTVLNNLMEKVQGELRKLEAADKQHVDRTGQSDPGLQGKIDAYERAMSGIISRGEDLGAGAWKDINPEKMAAGMRSASAASREFAASNGESLASVSVLDAAIKEKLLLLQQLQAGLKGAAAAQKEFNAAHAEGSASGTTKGQLSEKITYSDKGDPKVTKAFSAGAGRIARYRDGKLLSEESDTKDYFAGQALDLDKKWVDAAIERRRTGAGGVGSRDQAELIREQLKEREALMARMSGAGLEDTDFFKRQALKASTLRSSAQAIDSRLDQRDDKGLEKAFNDLILGSAKNRAAQIEQEAKANRSNATSKTEAAEATRKEAAAYRDLREGLSGVRGSEALQRDLFKKSARSDLQANGLDAAAAKEIDAAAKEKALADIKLRAQQTQKELERGLAGSQSETERASAIDKAAASYRGLHQEMEKLGKVNTPVGAFIENSAVRNEGKAAAIRASLDQQKQAAASVEAEFNRLAGTRERRVETEQRSTGRIVSESLKLEQNGLQETIKLRREYNKEGDLVDAKLSRSPKALTKPGGEGDDEPFKAGFGKFGKTLGTVVLWMTAYETFFSVLNAIKSGIGSMTELEAHTAQLQSVMRGTRAEAMGLRDVTLDLAVATGRGSVEAMDAAVRWERLGLNQADEAKAVEISLKSANISGMSAAQTAEAYSAIYSSYGAGVMELSSVFNEMNAMAVRFNAADKDIIAGLARTGSVAHQAGLELSQTMSMIAVITGRTGRPGAESGNALKRLITNLGKPDVQEELHASFGISVTDKNEKMKSEGKILDELYLKYITLGEAEKVVLLNKVAGAQQASRIAALMDGYLQARGLEVQALGDVNRAEIENKLRRDTLQRDLSALSVEWQKMWAAAGDAGLIRTAKGAVEWLTDRLGGMTKNYREHGADLPEMPFLERNGKPMSREEVMNSMAPRRGDGESEEDYKGRREEYMKRVDAAYRELRKRLDNGSATRLEKMDRGKLEDYEKDREEGHFEAPESLEDRLRIATQRRDQASRSASMFDVMIGQVKDIKDFGVLKDALDGAGNAEANPKDRARLEDQVSALIARKDAEGLIALFRERQRMATAASSELEKDLVSKRQVLLAAEESRLKTLQEQLRVVNAQGKEDPELERRILDSKRKVDELAGTRKTRNVAGEEGDDEGDGKGSRRLGELARHGMEDLKLQRDAFPLVTDTAMERLRREEQVLNEQTGYLARQKNLPATTRQELEYELQKKKELLAIDLQSAAVRDRIAERTRIEKNIEAQFRVGRTDTEQDFREGGALLSRMRAADPATQQVEILQMGNRLEQIRLELEGRRYKLIADIANEKRRENEEASKSLLMAGREDQMRAAMAAKFLQSGGRFTADSFMFLDPSVKKNFETFAPDALPREIRTRRRDMENELGMIDGQPGRQRLEQMIQGRNRARDMIPGAGSVNVLPQIQRPVVNLSFGAEGMQYAQVIGSVVQTALQAEIALLRGVVMTMVSSGRVGQAQRAGANSV